MTNFQCKPPQDPLTIPAWQEAKEKRKKQLEEIRNHRRVMYELMQKMRLQPSGQQ